MNSNVLGVGGLEVQKSFMSSSLSLNKFNICSLVIPNFDK